MTEVYIPLKDTAPTPVPTGVYNVEVEKVGDLRTVTGTGDPAEVVDVTWRVIDGEMEGRKIVDTYWLVERAFWRVSILTMQLMGVKRESLPEFHSTEELEAYMKEHFTGLKATIEIEVVTKNDQERNRVRKVFAAS